MVSATISTIFSSLSASWCRFGGAQEAFGGHSGQNKPVHVKVVKLEVGRDSQGCSGDS